MASGVQAGSGSTFTASIPTPPFQAGQVLGARIEVPVTRAVVGERVLASVGADTSSVTMVAPTLLGDYQIVWQMSDGTDVGFQPLVVVSLVAAAGSVGVEWPEVDEEQVRPTVADVAQLERIRTIDLDSGDDVGTFTDNTRPTAGEVDGLIDVAMDDVVSALPVSTFAPKHYRQVRRVITLGAAMMVEASYYEEQAPDRAGPVWQTLYQNGLTQLQARIESDMAQNNLIGAMEPGAILA